MAELWRTALTPVFVQKHYPGRMFRLLEGICEIQRGRHQDAYLGVYRLAQLTGIDEGSVWRMLRRLVADDVLQVVEWSRVGGRIKAGERHGAPGAAHKYALGRATYQLSTTPATPQGIEPLQRRRAISSGVSYDPPSSEKDASRSAPALGEKSPARRGLAALSPDLVAPSHVTPANGLHGIGEVLRGLDLAPVQRRRGRVSLGGEQP